MRIVPGMKRRVVLAAIISGALLTLADSRSDGSADESRTGAGVMLPAPSTERPVAARPARGALELPRRSDSGRDADNLFARHSWHVAPPPPPPPPAVPVAPSAPPLPFTYMGQYAEVGGGTVYFLQQGDRAFDVREGDVLDGTYVVEGESGGQLMFTYLPLKTPQGLPVGPTS